MNGKSAALTKGDGFDLRKLLFAILFFYGEQPFEYNGGTPGYVLTFRCILAALFITFALASRPYFTNSAIVRFALVVPAYLLLLNTREVGSYAFLGSFLIFWGIIAADLSLETFKEEILWAVQAYMVFNLAGLLLALGWAGLSGDKFDFHHVLFPVSRSRLQVQFGFPRLSGFQIEPGTYANWMYLALSLRILLKRRVLSSFNTICAISMVATFSVWAFMAAGFYFLGAALEFLAAQHISPGVRNRTIGAILVLALAGWIFPDVFLESSWTTLFYKYYLFLQTRLSTNPAGSSTLMLDIYALANLKVSAMNALFFGQPLSVSFCPVCAHPYDLGLWASLIFHLGMLPAICLVFAFVVRVVRIFGWASVTALVPVFLTKTLVFDALPWTIIAVGLFAARPIQRLRPLNSPGLEGEG